MTRPENAYRSGLLTMTEVATMFGVTRKTVSRWARAGKFTELRTPGGDKRYRAEEIVAYQDQTRP